MDTSLEKSLEGGREGGREGGSTLNNRRTRKIFRLCQGTPRSHLHVPRRHLDTLRRLRVKVKCLLKKLILKGIRASEPPFWEMNQALEHLPSPHELTTPDHHRQ